MSKKIFGFGLVLSAVLVFTNPVFAISENITKINFTSSPQTINVNTNSEILSTQTQNNTENPEEQVSESGTTLNYSSTSETGQFSNANETSCTDSFSDSGTPFTLTMRSGSANKHFCYKDSTPGTYTLTVSAEGKSWTPATQEIVILEEELIPDPEPEPDPDPIPDPEPEPEPELESIMIHLSVQTSNETIYNQEISVTPCDNGDDVKATPYCALEQAEIPSDWDGLWINSISGIENNFSSAEIKSWTWIANLDFSNFDLSAKQYELQSEDEILFYFETNPLKISDTNMAPIVGSELTISLTQPDYISWPPTWTPAIGGQIVVGSNTFDLDENGEYKINIINTDTFTIKGQKTGYIESPSITITPVAPNQEEGNEEENNEEENGGGGGGNNDDETTDFNIQKAIDYLESVQSEDGSFGNSDLYTDWVAVTYGAKNVAGSSKSSLLEYLNSNNDLSSLLTDNERRAMAILALDKNPYSFNETNYIGSIINSFDGTQFGDTDLVNDDIFALIPLKNAGYTSDDDIIIKDVAFLISEQNSNGSWVNSVDITAATIQALKPFESIEGVSEALSGAENYLKDQQNSDGGWENSVFSTSWAMQAESALNASWEKSGKTGLDFLATQQVSDGAVSPSSEELSNRIWATSYAISAASGKSWSEIMRSVSKPASQNNSQDNSDDDKTSGGSSDTNNPNPETPTESEPVICPVGHSFSATTGEACTAIATPVVCPPGNLFSATTGETCTMTNEEIVIETPATNQNNNSSTPRETSLASQIQEPTELLPQTTTAGTTEINSDTLTAAAIGALPAQTTNNNTIPIALGALSGIILLYFVFKFFVK